jgi:AraC-like DNA-binding protein
MTPGEEAMTLVQQSFSSGDPDAVEARMRQQYGKVALRDAKTTMDEHVVIAPEFLLNRIVFTGSFSVSAEPPALTGVVSRGHHRWVDGDGEGDARLTPLLVRPDMPMSATCRDTRSIAITFDDASLGRIARQLYADEDLEVRFALSTPVDQAHGRLFRNLLVTFAEHLPVIASSPLLRASMYRTVAASVLTCFPLCGEATARRGTARSQREGYRRARTFIADHAGEPITVGDVAEAASLSAAQLDDAVHRFSAVASTGMGELRRARLSGAHEDLRAADPTRGDTVRHIAQRWGFPPGNFARTYRAAYGVTPRRTLER